MSPRLQTAYSTFQHTLSGVFYSVFYGYGFFMLAVRFVQNMVLG